MEAYGFNKKKDVLTQLLELNLEVHLNEQENIRVQAPGLPSFVQSSNEFITEDCIDFL